MAGLIGRYNGLGGIMAGLSGRYNGCSEWEV